VLHLDRFDGIAEHLLLDLAIGYGEAVMLSFVFSPRINLEGLQIGVWSFGIGEHSPTRCAVAATDSLILVDLIEELLGLSWIDDIDQDDENRSLVWRGLLNHGRLSPVIPTAEIQIRIWQLEQRRE